MLGILIALVVTIVVGYLILKDYKPHSVLIFAGIILMLLSIVLNTGSILPEDESTGFVLFDIFEFIKRSFSGHGANLGLIIMSVGGFARYMDHVGASRALVNIAIKPLRRINAPYVVLAIGYIIGQILNIFIPSASGLGVLLMVTMYPILIELGVSSLSATAMIGTAACLDLGPASGASNLAAETSGLDATTYFMKYQVPVSIVVMIVIAILHYIVQKHFDEKEGHNVVDARENNKESNEEVDVPGIYALLPIIPLILIFTFSKLIIDSISMNVITAMLIGLILTMVCEMIRHRDIKSVFKSIEVFFNGMGAQWAAVITLIVAGETFAKGLQTIGAIDTIIAGAQGASLGPALM
ncbi:MAG TPA: C4-dicarboxylate transporter DcuC, partial [Tissierellaceae bacterium]|nr:C4-dicarboxylate transporter DcuC [Tissierellaceae bacterium]